MAELKMDITKMAEGFVKTAKEKGLFVGCWIPVSERLPEKNVEVLVTTEWDCITIGEMFSDNDWFIHEGATNANVDEIKAWMPLPEPYKAEGSEKK